MKSASTWKMIIAIGLAVALFLTPTLVNAQTGNRVNIDYLSDSKFPLVQAYITVSDTQGLPVKNLDASNFKLSEDNRPINDFKIASVQNTEQPLAIVLALDTSGSMGYGVPQTALQKSIQAAKAFISSLAPQDYVALLSFSDTPSLAQDFTTDHAKLNTALNSLRLGKNTDMYDAIAKAATMLSNRGERRIIVLLTDGVNTVTGLSFDQAVNETQKWGAPIYPIGFGSIDKTKLQNLAALTGGSVQIQPDPTALEDAFSTVLKILREQYLLTFSSSLPADGAEHTLAVSLDFQGWHAEFSHHLIARPGQVTVTLPGYQEGQVIGGNVKFAPAWTGPSPAIAQLDISMDGKSITTVTAAPFEYTWNSTGTTPGSHAFTFLVKDTSGNTGQQSLNLQVQLPVQVQLSQPVEGATIAGKTTLVADVTALGSVQTVDFMVDGQPVGSVTSAPYQLEWNPGSLPAGRHVVGVKVTDMQNFSAETQATVNVAIKQGMDLVWIALLAVLAVAAVLIPISLRKRKQFVRVAASPSILPGQAILHELEGLNPGKLWPLGPQEVRLGRKLDENDIILKGLKASRRHAILRLQQDQYLIESVSPNNPLLVNDETVQQHILHPGDTIRLGETLLRFE